MKKIFALLLACLMVLSLGACKTENKGTEPTTAAPTYEVKWSSLPDDDVVGAWKPAEGVADEYVIFTPDSKLRIVYGTIVIEADINYGIDGYGNKSAYTPGSYLYGQWVYTIDGNTLTVTFPDDKVETFEAVDYTPITLQTKEGFTAVEELIGVWTNSAYNDSYKFTEDGYAVYLQKYDDGVNDYDTEVKHCYTVEDGVIKLYFYDGNDGEETVESLEYSIDGTKLVIDGNDYYLNGEGDPSATEETTAE